MDKEGLTLEQIKEIYVEKINDTYTLNLAVAMLENYDELLNKLEEKDKEIERLTAESTEWESKCYKYQDIINELEKDIQKEIDRTNDLILEDGGLGGITTIRKMLNETRQCILFRIKELKEGK